MNSMGKTANIAALVVLIAALVLLGFFQWLPALLFLPVAGGLYAWNPSEQGIPDRRQDN